jgi:hypothetical protein
MKLSLSGGKMEILEILAKMMAPQSRLWLMMASKVRQYRQKNLLWPEEKMILKAP